MNTCAAADVFSLFTKIWGQGGLYRGKEAN
jgi:hypothetical protein